MLSHRNCTERYHARVVRVKQVAAANWNPQSRIPQPEGKRSNSSSASIRTQIIPIANIATRRIITQMSLPGKSQHAPIAASARDNIRHLDVSLLGFTIQASMKARAEQSAEASVVFYPTPISLLPLFFPPDRPGSDRMLGTFVKWRFLLCLCSDIS